LKLQNSGVFADYFTGIGSERITAECPVKVHAHTHTHTHTHIQVDVPNKATVRLESV
jgi:hypothetical protein